MEKITFTREVLDSTTVTLHTGEVLSLQEHTKQNAEYLIKKLENFSDEYSTKLKETLKENLGEKWSVVRKALDKLEEETDGTILSNGYDTDMRLTYEEMIYPVTDQDDQIYT